MEEIVKRVAAVQGNFGSFFEICFESVTKSCIQPKKEEMMKTHAAALKREQDEVATLKTRLAEMAESHRAEMSHAASEKTRLEQETQKLREAADAAKKTAESAQLVAQSFQARIDAWAIEFKKVQENLDGEFLIRDTFPSYAL